MNTIIDLRSDTVTRPTPAMLEAMMNAKVGDDVYGEDESINTLQQYAASLFGKEAALFCPSGTMTNQIAIKVHTQPGDELLCADNAHVYKYEGGGIAFNSGVQAKTLQSDRGRISASQIDDAINGPDLHFPITKLVCVENTSNRGGGSFYSLDEMKQIGAACKKYNLKYHLDGARVFNAITEANYTALQLGEVFDSVSICLSKSLGAPVGSLVIGSHEFIAKAKRVRKVFGGGMRQAGFLAAAGLYALQNNIARLKEDHAKAKQIGELLKGIPTIKNTMPVDTNIIIFQFKNNEAADAFQQQLKSENILCGKTSNDTLRMVFHLDISDEMRDNIVVSLQRMLILS
jgi:threonine aldolase